MRVSAQQFLSSSQKAITLIGMSGAGKTYISCQLEKWGWTNYSGDFEIGDKYMRHVLNFEGAFTAENISALSEYLGKLGDPALGGLPLDEFQKRQKQYYDAECSSLKNMVVNGADFVHDSTGSLCEIEDEDLLRSVGEKTLFVYLKTDIEAEELVLRRAYEYPKPLFFPPDFLRKNLEQFLSEKGLEQPEEMVPDEFSRWVFPRLFEARKPKYQRLADLYGVSIAASEFQDLPSADDFTKLIAKHLP